MYSSIINPLTHKPIPIYSKKGKLLIKYYLQNYNTLKEQALQHGGIKQHSQSARLYHNFVTLILSGKLETTIDRGLFSKSNDLLLLASYFPIEKYVVIMDNSTTTPIYYTQDRNNLPQKINDSVNIVLGLSLIHI